MTKLEGLLVCPDCGGSICELSCTACSRQFEQIDGTPCLFPNSAEFTFEVPYVPLERVKACLEHVLERPSGAGAHKRVHHLDGAHVPLIEGLPKGATVLEVGCGGGQMRHYIEGLGLEYFGTDISKIRVHEELRRYGGPDFLSDLHVLPVRDVSVDLLYCAAVTEHLAAPHRGLQEIYRVLKPGGLFLGNCSFMEPWHDESFFHISPNGAAALLLQAGFQPLAIWPSYRYSGYQALLNMVNKGTRLIRFAGPLLRAYANGFFRLKRILRRDEYSDRDYLADVAVSAGATDWIARKPDANEA